MDMNINKANGNGVGPPSGTHYSKSEIEAYINLYNTEDKQTWYIKENKLIARCRSQAEIDWRKNYHRYRLFRKHYFYNLYTMIESYLDEEIPKRIAQNIGNFADIKTIGLGDIKPYAQFQMPNLR